MALAPPEGSDLMHFDYIHDGCSGCKHVPLPSFMAPCRSCKGTVRPNSVQYTERPDLWEPITKPEPEAENDVVNHPSHYTQGGIECIDAMESAFGAAQLAVYCKIAAFKYIWRCERKNGAEDVKKAIWYLNKFLELEGDTKDDAMRNDKATP